MVQCILYKVEPTEEKRLLHLGRKQHIVNDSGISWIVHPQLQFSEHEYIDQLDYSW